MAHTRWVVLPLTYRGLAFVEHEKVSRSDVTAELSSTPLVVCSVAGVPLFESQWVGRFWERSSWCGDDLVGEMILVRLANDAPSAAWVTRVDVRDDDDPFAQKNIWVIGMGEPPFWIETERPPPRPPFGKAGLAGVREPRRPLPSAPSASIAREFDD